MNTPETPEIPTERTVSRKRLSPLEPLRHRAYTACWSTGILAHCAAWMQSLTVPFLVFEMTGSTAWLGAAAVAGHAPALFGSPAGGVLSGTPSVTGEEREQWVLLEGQHPPTLRRPQNEQGAQPITPMVGPLGKGEESTQREATLLAQPCCRSSL